MKMQETKDLGFFPGFQIVAMDLTLTLIVVWKSRSFFFKWDSLFFVEDLERAEKFSTLTRTLWIVWRSRSLFRIGSLIFHRGLERTENFTTIMTLTMSLRFITKSYDVHFSNGNPNIFNRESIQSRKFYIKMWPWP